MSSPLKSIEFTAPRSVGMQTLAGLKEATLQRAYSFGDTQGCSVGVPLPTTAFRKNIYMNSTLVTDELALLLQFVDTDQSLRIIELGCGSADLSKRLLGRYPDCEIVALEVDEQQHAKNLLNPTPGLNFVRAGAQDIPFEDSQFDLALMLKSLHHVPSNLMGKALSEVHRVLRKKGCLYISEPVFSGELNEIMRLFHDEQEVRAAALNAILEAESSGKWEQVIETFFDVPVHYLNFEEFERRLLAVTYLDHQLDAATLNAVREHFEAHMTPTGAHFLRPMRVNVLRTR